MGTNTTSLESLTAFAIAFISGVLYGMAMLEYLDKVKRDCGGCRHRNEP